MGKVEHIGSLTLSVVVSENRSHFFGIDWRPGVRFLFVKDGVFQKDVESVSAGNFAPFLWAFIDADPRPTGVPEKLACHTTTLFIYVHHLSRATAMEISDEIYELCQDHYEHLVFRRNTPSVSLLVSSLHAFLYSLFGSP